MNLAGMDQEFLLRSNSLAVSLYLALDPNQRDPRMLGGHVQAALGQAEEALIRRQMRRADREALLDRIRDALRQIDPRKRRDPGLAILVADDETRVVPLPDSVDPTAVVGRHFFIRPLLRFLGPEFFNILTVSAQGARLLECDRHHCQDRTPASFRHEVEDEEAITEVEKDFQMSPVARTRSGTPGGVVPGHSYESPAELNKVLLTSHLRRLAAAAETALKDDRRPVVLVAEPENGGHFRKLARLPQLLDDGISCNPDALSDEELVSKARALVQAPYDATLAEVLDHVNARLGSAASNVAIRLEEIVAAAHEGRVDAVVVADNETIWGQFDGANRTVHAHGTPDAADEELLNDVVVETLAKGGRAFELSRDKLPRQALAVATLRY
jgi:hypothetical protein